MRQYCHWRCTQTSFGSHPTILSVLEIRIQGLPMGSFLEVSVKRQSGGLPPYLKSSNRNNSAAVTDIFTKFGSRGNAGLPERLEVLSV